MCNAVADAHWDLRGASTAAAHVDVLISPCNIGRSLKNQSHLLVVYDVMLWESSELFDPLFGIYARRLIRYSVARADRTLTLSAHARDHLRGLVPTADVHVLTLPGSRGRLSKTNRTGVEMTVLMVGETAPHKNHVVGIEVVRRLRARTRADVRLRLIGPSGRAESAVRAALAAADPTGAWTTREVGLSDHELDNAYSEAWVLLQPSRNEGFGLPLVEASQRGLPVIHSGAGAMSEVLPSSSVGSTRAEAFEHRLEALLVEDVWEDESRAVLREAPRFSWKQFRDSLNHHLLVLSNVSRPQADAL